MKTGNKRTETLSVLKPRIVRILRKNGIHKAGIFGSYARGDQKKQSDIDILVEPTKTMDLYDFVGVKLALEELLKKKVDLISYRTTRKDFA